MGRTIIVEGANVAYEEQSKRGQPNVANLLAIYGGQQPGHRSEVAWFAVSVRFTCPLHLLQHGTVPANRRGTLTHVS